MHSSQHLSRGCPVNARPKDEDWLGRWEPNVVKIGEASKCACMHQFTSVQSVCEWGAVEGLTGEDQEWKKTKKKAIKDMKKNEKEK